MVQQDLWIAGGTGGVTRVGAASLRSWEGEQQDPIDYTDFGRADGFLSDECASGYPNMTITKDGKLWVATLGGAAMLDLSRLPPAAGKPFEYISEVEVDRKKRNAGRELILPPGLHHTELQLGSIELSSPERVHMQYRLEGIDSEWLDAKPDGAAVYTTIPHGSYLFHVRASNGDGVWDRQGIVYRITQEPFFYETAAFKDLDDRGGLHPTGHRLSIPASSGIGAYKVASRRTTWRNASASLVTCTTRYCRAFRARCSRFKLPGISFQGVPMTQCRLWTRRSAAPRRPLGRAGTPFWICAQVQQLRATWLICSRLPGRNCREVARFERRQPCFPLDRGRTAARHKDGSSGRDLSDWPGDSAKRFPPCAR